MDLGIDFKKFGRQVLFALAIICSGITLYAQQDTMSAEQNKPVKLSALPVIFYLPETKLGFGAAGIATIKGRKYEGLKPSQIQFAAVYTLRKQVLIFAPFELYFKKDKLRWMGELGYFKYYYNYFGQGITSGRAAKEVFSADFPKLTSSVSYAVSPHWYLGGLLHLEQFKTKDITSGSNVALAPGSAGGTISTIGLDLLFDSRDQIIFPTKGWFVNLKSEHGGKWTGASYGYNKYELDVRNFTSLHQKLIVASNMVLGATNGDLPFNQQFYYSSGIRLRGFDDRRYQDNNLLLIQYELRGQIYKSLSGVVFHGLGTLSSDVAGLFKNRWVHGYGLGLRYILNKRDHVNLRVDYARTAEGGNFYLTVKEAF